MKTKKKAKFARVEPSNKSNPFEVHINRSKHQVLGRKLKSDHGLPGISKNKALLKRKKSLLQEYKMKNKVNFFIDQRIGENNSSMTEDDRIMARFAAEKMRAFKKKQMFNLSDSEVLTHKGQTLSEIERFEDVRSDDDEDDKDGPKKSGHLKGKFVENAHFGGGMLTKSNQDRESLIDQLINESKKRKAERQRNKEETLEATEQLDEDWKSIGNIITSNSKEENAEPKQKQKSDEYDLVMRQLKFEPQAKASQRVKTDEEIAKEEKEELERLEAERLKHLRETEQWQDPGRHRSADDLDDGFHFDGDDLKSVGSGEESEKSESDGEQANDSEKEDEVDDSGMEDEEEKGDSSEAEGAKGDESEAEADASGEETEDVSESAGEGSDDENAMEDLSDLMPAVLKVTDKEVTTDDRKEKKPERPKKSEPQSIPESELDLPFVMDVPESAEALAGLVRGRSARYREAVFSRILKTNHPNLNPANKSKILNLCDRILEVIKSGDVSWSEALALGGEWAVLSRWNAAECLTRLIDASAEDPDSANMAIFGATWWPSASRPTLGHLAAHFLASQPSLPLRFVCCYALLQDAKRTFVIYPEAITCLASCLNTATKSASLAALSNTSRHDIKDELKILLDNIQGDVQQPNDEQILYLTSVLLADFVKVYKIYPQAKVLFKSVSESLPSIKTDDIPKKLKEALSELRKVLEAVESAALPALVRAAQRPKALRQYEPLFGVVREGDRGSRRLPADALAHQKLVRRHRHETKGALRELRRDRRFLASVKLRQTVQSDELRMKKVKEIFGSAASQQGELRKLKRKK